MGATVSRISIAYSDRSIPLRSHYSAFLAQFLAYQSSRTVLVMRNGDGGKKKISSWSIYLIADHATAHMLGTTHTLPSMITSINLRPAVEGGGENV